MSIASSKRNIEAVCRFANGEMVQKANEQNKFHIGEFLVHCKSASPKPSGDYPFNISDNSRSADFCISVCGFSDQYYVLPRNLIEQLANYEHRYRDQYGRPIYHIYLLKHQIGYGRFWRTSIRDLYKLTYQNLIS